MTFKANMVLTVLALSCFSHSATAQGNLVVNGGFDTDASGWTLTNGASYLGVGGNPPGSIALTGSSAIPTASQEINGLTPGQFYTISGDYYGGGAPKIVPYGFGVALDGIFLFETNAPTSDSWYGFSFNWQAVSANVLLSLSAQINGTPYPYVIDNISMQAVPEPGSLCLIGAGAVASAIFFRNRKRRAAFLRQI